MPKPPEEAARPPGWTRRQRLALGLVVLVAGALRLALALWTVDAPGDGPSRALLGWQWLAAPRLVRDGHWLPLGEVLVGLANLVLPDPLWAARSLSLVTGTASVALLAGLARALFGPPAGLPAAALLALLPMHVALSATALVDAPALFFLLLALRLALATAAAARPVLPLAGLALAAGLATGLRYEPWLLVPLLALHQLLATRSLARAGLVLLAVLPMPAFWTLAALGGPAGLLGGLDYVAASGASAGGAPVPPSEAAAIAGAELLAALGPLTALLAAFGLVFLPFGGGRARAAAALLWLLLLGGCLALLLLLAAGRGASLVDRYALPGAVLALPLAAAALARLPVRPPVAAALVLAVASSTAIATWMRPPELYLRREVPAQVRAAADWLARQRRPGGAVLLTRAGWWSTYVALLARLGRDEHRIVSWYLEDRALRAFLARARPTLLVTRPADGRFLERIRAAGAEPGPPLATFGTFEIRPLRLPATAPRP